MRVHNTLGSIQIDTRGCSIGTAGHAGFTFGGEATGSVHGVGANRRHAAWLRLHLLQDRPGKKRGAKFRV